MEKGHELIESDTTSGFLETQAVTNPRDSSAPLRYDRNGKGGGWSESGFSE